jgi:hypothetical protein
MVSMVLILDFLKRKFLGLGVNFEALCMLWRCVFGSYCNTHDFSPARLQWNPKNWDCLDKSGWGLGMMWVSVASAHPWACLGRTFRKSSWRIWRIVSLLMFNSSDVILRVSRRSRVIAPRIFAIASAFREVEGRPLLGSSWRKSNSC